MKKKCFAFLCALAVCLVGIPFDAQAVASDSTVVAGDGYTITEYAGAMGQTVRVLERNDSVAYSVAATAQHDFAEVKESLAMLGMDQRAVDKLTEDELTHFASTPKIYTASGYYVCDEQGNLESVTKETALAVASQNDARTLAGSGDVSGEEKKGALYVSCTASDLADGHGGYRYQTTGYWLTMPSVRATDTIGAIATSAAVQNLDLASGYYSYTLSRYDKNSSGRFELTSSQAVEEYLENIQHVWQTGSKYQGIGASFSVPMDIESVDLPWKYENTNFFVSFTCFMNVEQPTQVTNFNAIGSYAHTTVGITLTSPGLTLKTGGAEVHIGIEGRIVQDPLNVLLYIEYMP